MRFILWTLLILLPKFAVADELCPNPKVIPQFDFKNFEYKESCENESIRIYSQLGDLLKTGKYPNEHDYSIEIRLYADHSADIVNRDNIWWYGHGGSYEYWDEFETTWSSNGSQIIVKDVGVGVAVQCPGSKEPSLSFKYDPKLKGLLAGTNRLLKYSETKEYGHKICK